MCRFIGAKWYMLTHARCVRTCPPYNFGSASAEPNPALRRRPAVTWLKTTYPGEGTIPFARNLQDASSGVAEGSEGRRLTNNLYNVLSTLQTLQNTSLTVQECIKYNLHS